LKSKVVLRLCNSNEIIRHRKSSMKFLMTFSALVIAMISAGSDAMAGTKINNANQGKELKVGDAAPNWKMTGSDGKVYQLSDFKGKKAVVVSWYPMALTGG
jgi:hypothetical protein